MLCVIEWVARTIMIMEDGSTEKTQEIIWPPAQHEGWGDGDFLVGEGQQLLPARHRLWPVLAVGWKGEGRPLVVSGWATGEGRSRSGPQRSVSERHFSRPREA